MPTREYSLANGQLAASAGTLLAGSSLPPNVNGTFLSANFQNTAVTSEVVVITLQVAGGTARRVARATLATNESLQINGIPIQPDDTLLGTTTNASAVDYVISGGSDSRFSVTVLDANGAVKASSSVAAGFIVGDDALGAFGSDSEFRFSFDTTDANANELLLQMPAGGAVNVPVLAIGQSIESVDLGMYNGVVNPTVALFGVGAVTSSTVIDFRKARGTIAAPTAITTGDDLGMIRAYSCVAAGEYVESVRVTLDSTGTIATTRGAGQFKVAVATDAAPSVMTERLLITGSADITLTPATDVLHADGTGIVVGHTAQLTVAGVIPEFQVLGTTTGVDGSMALVTASTTNGSESQLVIGKVGNAALGSFTTVAQSENLGSIAWVGDDGTDLATVAARIRAVVNASGTVAASRVPTDLVFYTDPGGADDAIAEQMRLGCGGLLLINDTSHAGMTKGLCINQGAADDLALTLKSSDVATVLTTIVTGTVETDDYFAVGKWAAATGGALIQALGENAAVTTNLRIESYGGQADATHTAAGRGLVEFYVSQHDGANALADVAAAGNALAVIVRTGTADTTRFIVDEDGEVWSDAGITEYDEHDDVAALRGLSLARGGRGLVASRWDAFVGSRESELIDMGILGAPVKDGGLVSITALQRLQTGAIWQLTNLVMEIAAALPEEVRKALPVNIQQRLALAA